LCQRLQCRRAISEACREIFERRVDVLTPKRSFDRDTLAVNPSLTGKGDSRRSHDAGMKLRDGDKLFGRQFGESADSFDEFRAPLLRNLLGGATHSDLPQPAP
jgi:hypothetical protein